MKYAIDAVRSFLAGCDATDQELEKAILSAAVKHGVVVKFDASSTTTSAVYKRTTATS